jgi:hypothetical protein
MKWAIVTDRSSVLYGVHCEECKRSAKAGEAVWFKQVLRDNGGYRPVLFHKRCLRDALIEAPEEVDEEVDVLLLAERESRFIALRREIVDSRDPYLTPIVGHAE